MKIVVKRLKFGLLISGGHNVTSTHDKASLITYLCTPGRLLLQVINKLSVNLLIVEQQGSGSDKIILYFFFISSLQLEEICLSDIKFLQWHFTTMTRCLQFSSIYLQR